MAMFLSIRMGFYRLPGIPCLQAIAKVGQGRVIMGCF